MQIISTNIKIHMKSYRQDLALHTSSGLYAIKNNNQRLIFLLNFIEDIY